MRIWCESLEERLFLAANPIVTENQLPGTPQSTWDVSGPGDSTLQGFATDISVNVGQTVQFKITDTANAAYHIDIYRMGYYQGNGARLVANIPSSQTLRQVQPAPLTNAATGLVDCGNWAVSASWNVPADATSGIYFAKLVRDDTGGASHVLFVVRNDAGHSDLLFQTSDATWEAYNTYGGNSLYSLNGSTSARATKVSYNRPIIDRGNNDKDGSAFYAEYPMVRWLEKNGYDVSYFTDVDSDRNGALIKNHKAFLSVGHDEYWSGAQRSNVQAARDAGVNLDFFSGNEIYWKTRWENSTDPSGTPYRTLVCYKETHANAVTDPADPSTWTGTWRDPRFSPPADGGRPENGLSGTIFTVDRGADPVGTPITVPGIDAGLRFWRNTAVAGLAPGQSLSVGDAVLGYEWDEDLDNGSRPAGLIDLSSTTQNVTDKLIDYGTNTAPGTATHSLTLYKAASGARVFSAGTVQWSWGLDGSHDQQASVPDVNLQQATVNLLADEGVQPGTLQANLVAATASADALAPTSVVTSPAAGAALTSGTAVTITGTAADSGGGVVGGVEVSVDGGTTWHPATGRSNWSYSWVPGPTGSVTIKTRAADDSGNIETPSAGMTVNVAPPTLPLSIWSSTAIPATTSASDGGAIELGARFRSDINGFITGIRFYKGTGNIGTHVGNLWSNSGALLASGTFTGESASGWQQLNFASPVAVTANTVYIASYFAPAGHYAFNPAYFAVNRADNGPLHALPDTASGRNGLYAYSAGSTFPAQTFNSANYWVDVVFSAAATDTTPPTVTAESPAPGSANVSASTAVTATFSESIQAATLSFVLRDSSNNLVPASISYNDGTHTATLAPTSPLNGGTSYTAMVSGAKDVAGNVMTAPVTWNFSTVASGAGSFSFWSNTTIPVNSSANDAGAVELGVKFRSDISGFITGVRFYKGSGNTGTHLGNLWSSSGQLLGSTAFTGESATGWQTVTFASPVAVAANTVYVASYFAPAGHYAYDPAYFATSGVDEAPIHALANGVSGGNGVYAYGGTSRFPSSSFNSTNYWVDVIFTTSASDTTPPTVTGQTPAPGATAVALTVAPTVTFSEAVQASTVSFVLKDAAGNTVPAAVAYDAVAQTATLTPSAALVASTTYTATVSGAKDAAGNAMATPVTWSFTTAAAVGTGPYSVWPDTTVPSTTAANDGNAVELGMKFRSDVAGTVSAIQFYKGATNTGTHVGHLWAADGTLLATATFTNETASGWQTVTLSQPVTIAANTTYVVSYYAPVGRYAANGGYFASAGADSGPLHALAAGVDGSNGLYRYGTGGGFPTSSFNSTNYWVDVVFSPGAPPDTDPPTVTGRTPAPNATAVATTVAPTATFSESVQASTVSFVLKDPGGNTVPGAVAYDDTTRIATFTPSAALATGTIYTATVSGAKDSAGNVMAPVSWPFTTAAASWSQTSAADFGAGSTSGAVVTNLSGGEVQLAPAVLDDFTGTVLSNNWNVTSWSSQGGGTTSVTVSGGNLSVAGAEVLSAQAFNQGVQGLVSFAATPYQHFGLATDFGSVSGQSWAMFSTMSTTNTLFARVNNNGATQDVSLGALPTGSHAYRVQAVSGGFGFYVDGVLKTTILATLPGGTQLHAALSSFSGSQPALVADSITSAAYVSTGTFTSSVLDAGNTSSWGTATWTASLPAGAGILVETSSGSNTANPDGTWSAWSAVSNGGPVSSPPARYLRYRITFTTSDPSVTAVLSDITFTWS